MQSEGGAAGAVHGALQSGALTTTFTASQGLLLMIPNMFKIAGELTPTVFHVAARALATQALSIFGDHSDVMAVRATGFALLSSGSVQEAHDAALIAQAATLALARSVPALLRRLPHLARDQHADAAERRRRSAAMIDDDLVRAHRARALNPEHPFIRGTAHNPDTFFQARETVNPFYAALPGIVQAEMDRFAAMTGRQYHLFDYDGPADAERVVVLMGSGAETARETAAALCARGRKSGRAAGAAVPAVLRRRISSPRCRQAAAPSRCWSRPRSRAPPASRCISTSSPRWPRRSRAANAAASAEGRSAGATACRRKDFGPADGQGGVRRAAQTGAEEQLHRRHQRRCVAHQPDGRPGLFDRADDVVRAVFYGLGADGTVGANKNTVKIIAEDAGLLRAGLFRLRFAQVGRADHLAPALRPAGRSVRPI